MTRIKICGLSRREDVEAVKKKQETLRHRRRVHRNS